MPGQNTHTPYTNHTCIQSAPADQHMQAQMHPVASMQRQTLNISMQTEQRVHRTCPCHQNSAHRHWGQASLHCGSPHTATATLRWVDQTPGRTRSTQSNPGL